MTRKQKLDHLRANGSLKGETLFMPILMHFAARVGDVTYADFASDHRARVSANIACLEQFDLDCVTLMSDPYAETSAFGARIEYLPEAVPRCLDKVVSTADDIRDLAIPDLTKAERIVDRIEGARMYQRVLAGTVPVIGWVEGPLAEACDLMGMTEMFMLLMTDPASAERLMDKTMIVAKEFARLQIDAGCDVIGIGDAVCSQIDRDTYDAVVVDRHRELVTHIQERGGIVKFHVCGDITHLLPSIAGLGVDMIDLDSPVDIAGARQILGDGVIITGNLDPTLILGKDATFVGERSVELVALHGDTRYVLAGGCEIGVNTPYANVRAMLDAARRHGPRY